MLPTQPQDAEAHRRAVLAAVLAVHRGYLSAEGAMLVLGGLFEGEGATPAPTSPVPASSPAPTAPIPSTGLEAKPAPAVATDAMATIMAINPHAPVKQLGADVDKLMQQGNSALAELGLDAAQQATLASLRPGAPHAVDDARRTLHEVARKRIDEIRARLPIGSPVRYQVQRELARGGMGRILVAIDNAIGREVALKEVLTHHRDAGRDPSEVNPEGVDRFLREARVTGQLEHPGIVPVYEISRRDDGSIFYTMKLVRGQSMAERLAQIATSAGTDREKLAERLKLLEAFLAVCHAIAYAHSRGVIHRDLKPHNIMLGAFGETVLLDWGLARLRGDDSAAAQGKGRGLSPTMMKHGRENRTLDGSVMGTPAYMPPEQARGQLELVDDRSDVYSLGAILYEILSGKPPYEGESGESVVAKVLESPPEPLALRVPKAPAELVRLVEKAMERDRDLRLESADLLAKEIAAFRDGRPLAVYQYSSTELLGRFVRRNKAVVAVGALAVAALVAVVWWSVVSITKERDDAKDALSAKESALAAAEAAEAKRLNLENTQREERAGLVRQRKEQIAARLKDLALLAPEAATARVTKALDELKTAAASAHKTGDNVQEVTRTASGILDIANARAEVVRLVLEPVAGRLETLMDAAELARQQALLLDERLLAAGIATANGDFALAELILNGTSGATERVAAARKEVDEARSALGKRHVARLEEIFVLIRADPKVAPRPVTAEQIKALAAEVGGWHDLALTGRLVSDMREITRRVREGPTDPVSMQWPLYSEMRFLAGVLILQGQPEETIAPMADVLKALIDKDGFDLVAAHSRPVVELAIDLCRAGNDAAWAPLADLAGRAGRESPVWMQVRRHFWRVPEPAGLAADADVDASVRRAQLYRDQGRHEGAIALLRRTRAANPEHRDTLLNLATFLVETRAEPQEAVECLDHLLALDPNHARGLAVKAWQLMRQVAAGEGTEATITAIDSLLEKAVESDPGDWYVRCMRGRSLMFVGAPESETEIKFRNREGAMQQFTAAIDAGCRVPDVFEWRCLARFMEALTKAGDMRKDMLTPAEWALALADIDHAIALDPDNARYAAWRMLVMLALGDLEIMVRDLLRMSDLNPAGIERVLQDLEE